MNHGGRPGKLSKSLTRLPAAAWKWWNFETEVLWQKHWVSIYSWITTTWCGSGKILGDEMNHDGKIQ
jgi:hypothetical protein